MKSLLLAHSPDADDLFMYYAIVFGWVGNTLKFQNTPLDIQTLNTEAIKGTYDISAISFGVYPHIANDYALLRCGVSFGNGYGPKLVKKRSTKLKRNFKVALSGEHTTNALIFRIKYPDARVIYKNFLEIEESVLSGEVDAGVLIHESILNFDSSLEVECELWDLWCELVGEECTLPLGGMAIRRSIPILKAIECEEILTKAVEVATKHKKILSDMLLQRGAVRVNQDELDRYLSLYANEDSISLSLDQLQSIDKLFWLGYKAGIFTHQLKCEDYLIPKEYKQLRFS